jgi:hypothetical protein
MLEDDVFFAELSKRISLLITDDDEGADFAAAAPLTVSPRSFPSSSSQQACACTCGRVVARQGSVQVQARPASFCCVPGASWYLVGWCGVQTTNTPPPTHARPHLHSHSHTTSPNQTEPKRHDRSSSSTTQSAAEPEEEEGISIMAYLWYQRPRPISIRTAPRASGVSPGHLRMRAEFSEDKHKAGARATRNKRRRIFRAVVVVRQRAPFRIGERKQNTFPVKIDHYQKLPPNRAGPPATGLFSQPQCY